MLSDRRSLAPVSNSVRPLISFLRVVKEDALPLLLATVCSLIVLSSRWIKTRLMRPRP